MTAVDKRFRGSWVNTVETFKVGVLPVRMALKTIGVSLDDGIVENVDFTNCASFLLVVRWKS